MAHNGTLNFLAPECVKSTTGTNFYSGRAVDIWALGMTIFNMVFNDFPFSIEAGVDVRKEINNVNF
jgi:serine/threonine protein kinase